MISTMRKSVHPLTHYHFNAEQGPIEALDGHFSGKTLLALKSREFTDPQVLSEAKMLMRTAIAVYLHGKPLKSRAVINKIIQLLIKMDKTNILLGVNIDHIATLRQARGTNYPEPVQAALVAEQAGADGITAHLREDRRHIQDRDIFLLKDMLHTRLNMEMAVTDEMVAIALQSASLCVLPGA